LNNRLIADLMVYTDAGTLDADKAKKTTIDRQYTAATQITGFLQTINDVETWEDTWEGTFGTTVISAEVRALWENEGWDYGMGLGLESNNTDTTTTMVDGYNRNVRTEINDSDNTTNNTLVTTSSVTTETNEVNVVNTFSLPAAIQMNFLKNFAIQLGALHTITLTQRDVSTLETARDIQTTITTRDDGVVTTDVLGDSGNLNAATSYSSFTSAQATNFSYGVTWWPYEQVRVDMTGLTNLMQLSNYEISVSLYY
jgi:hypothetical protein